MLDPRGDVMAFAGLPSPLRVAVPCPDHRVYNSMRISSVASNRQRTHGAWRPAAGHSCQRPAAAISSQEHEPHQQQHIAASAALPVQVYWTVLLASHSRGGMKPFASRCGGAEAIHSEHTEKSSSQPSLLPSLPHAAENAPSFKFALVLRLHFVCTSSEIQPLYSQQPLMLLPLYSIPPFALATTEDNGVGASTVIAEETQTTSEIMQSSYQTAVLSSEVQRKVSFKEYSSDIRGVGTGPPLFFKASGLLLMGAEMFVRANLVDVLANEVPADVMRGEAGSCGFVPRTRNRDGDTTAGQKHAQRPRRRPEPRWRHPIWHLTPAKHSHACCVTHRGCR